MADTHTELAVMKPLTAAIVFAPGGVDAILEKITTEVRSTKTDISTPSGRAAVASLAYKVARSKTALDEMGKELVADWKKRSSAVDAERRTIREKLDTLKDEVRKPLTDWENADRLRIDQHEIALANLQALGQFITEPTVAEIDVRLTAMKERPARAWEEFHQRANEMTATVTASLTALRDVAAQREAERAELERLRAEQIAREQKERDDRIAAEAAEKARLAAEAKAKQEAEEVASRAEAERRRVEQEKAVAIARAEQAEADKIAAAAKAEDDKRIAAEAAERNRLAAIETERQRVADVKRAEDAATAGREADKKHRTKINNEALTALILLGITDEQGKAVIAAIARGEVPHIKIGY